MSFQQVSIGSLDKQFFFCNNLGKTILVVDDNPQVLDMLDFLLTDAGYIVKQASSATTAMEELMSGNFFALLTDLQMPSGNGWDLARLARRYNPDIKIAVLTGYGFLANPPSPGLVDLILDKPINIDLLLEKIDAFDSVYSQ